MEEMSGVYMKSQNIRIPEDGVKDELSRQEVRTESLLESLDVFMSQFKKAEFCFVDFLSPFVLCVVGGIKAFTGIASSPKVPSEIINCPCLYYSIRHMDKFGHYSI